MSERGFLSILLLSAALVACTGELSPTNGGDGDGDGDGGASGPQAVFEADVQPVLLGGGCMGCHAGADPISTNLFGASTAEAYAATLMSQLMDGTPLLAAPADSSALITYGDHADVGGGRAFTPEEIAAITPWIQMEIDAGNVQ